tara:strand:- start:513 stop:899 length:387 start_codon:yes stop_codon:yes gene_type:complete
MRVLLDTFPFVWLTSEPFRLSREATDLLSDKTTELFFSDASTLELCLMYGNGTVTMPQTPRRWIEKQRKIWRINMIPLRREAVFRVSELPDHHDDAVDRLLVATALTEDLCILSPDDQIQKYPITTIW